jgi:hypothetical protein
MVCESQEQPAGSASKKMKSKLSLSYMARCIFWSKWHLQADREKVQFVSDSKNGLDAADKVLIWWSSLGNNHCR